MALDMTHVQVDEWIEKNKSSFLPPVCNKLMHGHGQIKVMFIGGPNLRRDFHINEGEELFYQLKGDMVLRVMERGHPKDIPIKEGEVFLLPPRIPHSPQRYKDTVGLVLERERLKSETDGLRYYCRSDPTKPLWERWFYCYDLGSQLGPVITEYFASEEHKTDIPTKANLTDPCPVEIDETTTLPEAQNLKKLLESKASDLSSEDAIATLFSGEFQLKACRKGAKPHAFDSKEGQIWIWQHEGSSTLKRSDGKDDIEVKTQGSVLIEPGHQFELAVEEGGLALVFSMDVPSEDNPTKKAKDS